MMLTLPTLTKYDASPVLKDKLMPQIEDDFHYNHYEDDSISVDSLDTVSSEELEKVMDFSTIATSDLESPATDFSIFKELASEFGKTSTKTRTIRKKDIADNIEETDEMRVARREKNRLAARRCRRKQRDRLDYLEKDVMQIEAANLQVENEIQALQTQLQDLKQMLLNHNCVLQAPRLTHFSPLFQNYPDSW